jgi:long-subunit fatty acid transport protein
MGVGELGTIPVQAQSQVLAFYDPARVGLGFGFKNKKLGAYLGLENVQFSKFKANVVNMSNGIFEGLDTGELSRNPITLKDSWTIRSGFELKEWAGVFTGKVNSQIGFEYQTSAMPNDPTSLAILDTDKTVLNLGSGFRFPKLGEFIKMPLTINLGFKWTHLFDDSFTIVNNTGGVSSAQIGGNVYSFISGVTVEI